MNQLIRCINCNQFFMRTSFDQCPEFILNFSPPSDSFQSFEKNDFQDFLKSHHGHQLEDLKVLEDSYVSEKAYFEPIKVSFFKATNGKEVFVIKKFREKIEDPLKYQLLEGDYTLKCNGIEIESDAISKQMEDEFKENPLSREKIAAFLKLYQHITEIIDIKNIERIPEDSIYPLEIYYRMDDLSLMYLLRNCRNLFKGKEYDDIEKFIYRHKDDGVLLLKAIYTIEITEKTASKKKPVTISLPLEMEKIVEKKKS